VTAREVIEQALLPDVPKWTRYADKVLAALDEAGLAVVPKEATDAIGVAGGLEMERQMFEGGEPVIFNAAKVVWRAMIAAALSSSTAS